MYGVRESFPNTELSFSMANSITIKSLSYAYTPLL